MLFSAKRQILGLL